MIESFVIIGCGLVLSYVLAGLESAILSVSLARLRYAAKEGDGGAGLLQRAFRNRQHLLISILVVNSAVNLLVFAVLTRLFVDWVGPWGYLVSVVISLPVVVLWAEILPKAHFRRAPLLMLRRGAGLIWFLDWTLRPVVTFLGWVCSPFLKRTDTLQQRAESREAFQDLTLLFEKSGVLNHEETVMIRSVLDFHRVKVGDVMQSIDQVAGVPESMTVAELVAQSSATGIDQFPLFGSSGEVTGVVDVTAISMSCQDRSVRVGGFRAEIVTTRADDTAISAVKKIRRAGSQLAVVQNLSNQPIGIVSVADMTARMVRVESPDEVGDS